jgi:hypothetical protein
MLSPAVGNHGVLFRINGCETLLAMLSQWMFIMVYHAESVVMNDDV